MKKIPQDMEKFSKTKKLALYFGCTISDIQTPSAAECKFKQIVERNLPKNSMVFHLDNPINKSPKETNGAVNTIIFFRPIQPAIIPPNGAKIMQENPNAAAKIDSSISVKTMMEPLLLSCGNALVGYATMLPFEKELRQTAKTPNTYIGK